MAAQWKKDLVRRLWWRKPDGTLTWDDVPCLFDKGMIYYDVAELVKRAGPDGVVAFDRTGVAYDCLHSAAERIVGHPIAWPAEHPDMRESD